MSLWSQVETLPPEFMNQVQALYTNFPLLVRSTLANLIESWILPWNEQLDQDLPMNEENAARFVHLLTQELESRAMKENNVLIKLGLNEAARELPKHFSTNPLLLVRIIKQCLIGEMRLIRQAENRVNIDPNQVISLQIEELRRKIVEREQDVRMMVQEMESINITGRDIKRLKNMAANSNIHHEQFKTQESCLEKDFRTKAHNLRNMRSSWLVNSSELIRLVCTTQKKVLEVELEKWKRSQQLAGNGALFDNNLDKIQGWCETLAEVIWSHRQQIERAEPLFQNDEETKNSQLQSKRTLTDSLDQLVRKTFVVEKQPPQVMKTNTRFQSTVRFLVGGVLNVYMTPPTVKVTIVSEAQANNLDKINPESSGDILNSAVMMEYHDATRQLTCPFRNMQLRKIKRAEKKGTESVMDEKFALLFSTTFKIGGGDLVFHVKALSLPVVVIVHGNQDPHAWATVTWDNAFAEPGRVPFVIPNRMPWARVGEVLNMKFRAAVGSELNQEDLRFLAGKAFRNFNIPDYDSLLLTTAQFSKDPLPERNFTFWEWFYAILKVTRDHLKDLWNKDNRVIYGFISRKQAEDLLVSRPNGTFLLRYSDSEPGCVTIAYVNEVKSCPAILMIKPFNCRDLSIRSLADRINDLKHLTYLYPAIPKDQAFGKYYEPDNDINLAPNGYIKPVLVTQVPGWATSTTDSYPNTPQSVINAHSPIDPIYQETPSSVSSLTNEIGINAQTSFADVDFNMFNDVDYDVDINDFSGIPEFFENGLNGDHR